MKKVDTRGQLCPAPLIAAKKALRETDTGDTFLLLTDNKTSFDNLSRFFTDNRVIFQTSESDGTWTFTVKKTSDNFVKQEISEYCETSIAHFQKGDFIVVISSDKMGEGDETLGKQLIVNFIKALKGLDTLPKTIVFYNGGVKVAIESSQAVETLRDLEKMGVEMILCGTCVDYYSVRPVLGVGTISNMLTIAEVMAKAGSIIKP